ncbi:MAG TPA: prepilin-type cleavage/methylation domain-containing protein [Sulfurovum sp. UBA12169]|nr:MAG TPA: prepilin-type cleavage/methylation domain-containing protein [Sulfurovum sp. UBA12169]
MPLKKAFTLLEVLIAIALLGIMLPALYSGVEMLRQSNHHLFESLEKAKKAAKVTEVLYLDILNSDGKLDIKKDEFFRLCIENTKNSIYALPVAKVCWVVSKEQHALLRVEGNGYDLPLDSEDNVEIDVVIPHVELFDVYRSKDKSKVLVLIEEKDKDPITFMVQGVSESEQKKQTAQVQEQEQAPESSPSDLSNSEVK